MSKVTFYLMQPFPGLYRPADDQCRALRPQFEPLPAYIRGCEINQSLHLAVHSCCSLFHVSKHTESEPTCENNRKTLNQGDTWMVLHLLLIALNFLLGLILRHELYLH